MPPPSDRTWTPIGEALKGIEIYPMIEGTIPIDAIVLVKYIDEDGDPLWLVRYTKSLTRVETLGALTLGAALMEKETVEMYISDDDG